MAAEAKFTIELGAEYDAVLDVIRRGYADLVADYRQEESAPARSRTSAQMGRVSTWVSKTFGAALGTTYATPAFAEAEAEQRAHHANYHSRTSPMETCDVTGCRAATRRIQRVPR